VNALRTLVIPGLDAETAAIELSLEQREREDRFRLKLVKRRRGREARGERPGGGRPGVGAA